MPIRTQPKKFQYAGTTENNIGHRNVIGGFMFVSDLLMSVSTAYVEGDGSISFNSKYAVMWKLLFPSSIAYQNIRIEIMRKIRKFSGMVLPRFEQSPSIADDMYKCARFSMLSNSELEYFRGIRPNLSVEDKCG
jgi:hypothetical protein